MATIFKCNIRNGGHGRAIIDYSHGNNPNVRLEFIGPDRPSRFCRMEKLNEPEPQEMPYNRVDGAFMVLGLLIHTRPENSQVHLSISFLNNDIYPMPFPEPLPGITYLRTFGISDFRILNRLLNQISATPYETLVIGADEGCIFDGLARMEKVRTAQSLTIDGVSDITDDELATFACDELIVQSSFLTAEGLRRHQEKVGRMDMEDGQNYQWSVMCRMRGSDMPADLMTDRIIPPQFVPSRYYIETARGIAYHPPVFGQNNVIANGNFSESESDEDDEEEDDNDQNQGEDEEEDSDEEEEVGEEVGEEAGEEEEDREEDIEMDVPMDREIEGEVMEE